MIIHSDMHTTFEHICQYNDLPTSAVILETEDDIVKRQEFVIKHCDNLNANGSELFDTITITHRSFHPLSYVLLLSNGADGWHPGLRHQYSSSSRRQSSRVTFLMLYAYQLFQPPNQFSTILRGRRLFQPHIVHQFCKVESEHLKYL